MIRDPKMDAMLNDIVEIFTQIEGVKLVRIKGLTKRANRIADIRVDEETLDSILHKMKNHGIISWKYCYECPHCHEIVYQIEDLPVDKLRTCETCKNFVIPKDNLHNFQLIL